VITRHCVRLALAALLVVGAAVSRPGGVALAQEGHPLAGTWHGSWGSSASDRHDVTLVLDYDGKAIVGMLDPGPDSIHFDKVTLDPATWSVHFDARPKSGAPIAIDAMIHDITSRRRTLVGTWTQGSMKGDFKASRDD
jgi:hypothetical protein